MLEQIAYRCDENGIYIGEVVCQPSPLQPGVFLCPGGATVNRPPHIVEGSVAVYDFSQNTWTIVSPEVVPVNEAIDPFSLMSIEEKRAYVNNVRDLKIEQATQYMQTLQLSEWADGETVSAETKQAWFQYRQELIGCTDAISDITWIGLKSLNAFKWPEEPAL